MSNNKHLIFVMGATNSGKTTFLEKVRTEYPERTYLIQVGKIFRAKYPPDHFKGQAAPDWTEKEAVAIFFAEYEKAKSFDFILVDGQPRTMGQVELFSNPELFSDRQCCVFHLWAPRMVRLERATRRDNKHALDLALLRLDDDVEKLKKLLAVFTIHKRHDINTDKHEPLEKFEAIINNKTNL